MLQIRNWPRSWQRRMLRQASIPTIRSPPNRPPRALPISLVILPSRNFEKRWQMLEVNSEGDLSAQFKREATGLWLCAVGIPTALMAFIWIIP